MADEMLERRDGVERFCEVKDLTVRSDGSGRIVEAYVAHFNPRGEEIKDGQGHYLEFQNAQSFAKTIAERGTDYQVLFNHGRTYDGKPDGALMMPVGAPLDVRSDDYGVWSAVEYLDNPLADGILDAVKKKAIRGYSWSGTFVKSFKRPAAKRGDLPEIHRSENAMREFGPVLFPAYAGALITGTRMSAFLDEIAQLDPADIERFRQLLGTTPSEPVTAGTPTGAAQPDDPTIRSVRSAFLHARKTAREKGLINV